MYKAQPSGGRRWLRLASASRILSYVTAGPQPEVLAQPPVLVVEILSPGDTYTDTEKRASDYQRMGVKTMLDYRSGDADWPGLCRAELDAGSAAEVEGTPIFVDLAALFEQLG